MRWHHKKAKGLTIRYRATPWRIVLWLCVGMLVCAVGVVGWLKLHPAPTKNMPIHETHDKQPVEQPKPSVSHSENNGETPRYLDIPSLSIYASVVPLGLKPSGELEAPASNFEVGWYEKSALAGSGKGALLLDGHVGVDGDAVFKNLHQLSPRDTLNIERHDGVVVSYEVYFVEQKPLEQVDMRAMMVSADPTREGVNIITCAGAFDDERQTYTDRTLVYAVRVS